MDIFFYCGRLSSAHLDHWQAPKQRTIIDQHPVEQTAYRRDIKDNGYKSVFTNSWLERQRNRSWEKGIRQKSTKEWTHSLTAVPLGLRETPACWHRSWPKKRNACWDVRRSAVEKQIAGLYDIRCELVKQLFHKGVWTFTRFETSLSHHTYGKFGLVPNMYHVFHWLAKNKLFWSRPMTTFFGGQRCTKC